MRARNIKPGFFTCPELLELPYEARLLFAGLWCCTDREGRLEDRPSKIKLQVLPGDDLNVDVLLDQLHQAGFIKRYQVEDQQVIQIVNFLKHQRPHSRETESELPCQQDTKHNLGGAKAQPRQDQERSDTGLSDTGYPIPDTCISGDTHNEDVEEVFNHWVGKGNLIKHRMMSANARWFIQRSLGFHKLEEVLEAIDNYSAILASDEYILTHKWTLEKFQDHLEEFLTENDPFTSYKGKPTTTPPSTTGDAEQVQDEPGAGDWGPEVDAAISNGRSRPYGKR